MPLKNGHLTPQERQFVARYVECSDATVAARLAGYKIPAEAGSRLIRRPGVVDEIESENRMRLQTEGVPKAYRQLIKCLDDEKATHRDRNQAAKIVLDRADAIQAEHASGKMLSEMTADELTERIEQIRREQANRAVQVIDVEPAEPVDLFD